MLPYSDTTQEASSLDENWVCPEQTPDDDVHDPTPLPIPTLGELISDTVVPEGSESFLG